jgi:hypothetical protein
VISGSLDGFLGYDDIVLGIWFEKYGYLDHGLYGFACTGVWDIVAHHIWQILWI